MHNNILLHKKTNVLVFLFCLFWLSPFVSLILACIFIREKSSKHILILFCAYFGLVFIVPKSIGFDTFDSEFYAQQLLSMNFEGTTFSTFINQFYNIDFKNVDIYQPLITWILSNFTSNYHYLFGVFGLVFGYFYINSFYIIIKEPPYRSKWFYLIILLFFLLINPIWNINGVRMYTAMNIFFYGLLLKYIKYNKNGIYFIFISILIHISFIIPVFLYLLFNLFYIKNSKIYFYALILLVFMKNNLIVDFTILINYLPDILQSKLIFYTNTQYVAAIKEINDTVSILLFIANLTLNIITYSLLIFCYYYKNILFKSSDIIGIKYFNLMIYTFLWATILSMIPSGGRFLMLSHLMLISIVIYKYNILIKQGLFNIFKYILFLFILYFLVFNIRVGFDYYGLSLFWGNPFLSLFYNDIKPIILYF
jgi:hypothetical protein